MSANLQFIIACEEGDIEYVRYCLFEANIFKTEDGFNVRPGEYDIEAGDAYGTTAFTGACAKGQLEIVKILLSEYGTDINQQGEDNYTGLAEACFNGHKDLVIYLLSKGADKTIPNIHYELPIDLARKHGHDDIVKLLEVE